MTEPDVRFLTGGEIHFRNADAAISGVPSAALFVLLVLHHREPLSREYLASVLWPDVDAATARQRLRMALLKMRHQLGGDFQAKLKATKDNICLLLKPEDCDITLFEQVSSSDGLPVRLSAIELYAGDLLTRFPEVSESFGSVLRKHRSELRSRYFSLSHSFLEDAEEAGENDLVKRALQAALRVAPTSAEFVARALRFYGRIKSLQMVEETFATYKMSLKDELDAEPDQSIVELHGKVRKLIAEDEPTLGAEPQIHAGLVPDAAQSIPPAPDKNSPRRRASQPYLLVIGVIFLLALSFVIFRSFQTAAEPVFVLERFELIEADCSTHNPARIFDRAVQNAFLDVKDAVVVLSGADQLDGDERKAVYLVKRRASCEDQTTRGALTILRKSSGEVVFVSRYDVSGLNEADLVSVISKDLERVDFR